MKKVFWKTRVILCVVMASLGFSSSQVAGIPVSGTGDIFIESDPSEAVVYLDGESKGKTPLELKGVSSGWHIVTLKKGKKYKGEFEVNLEAGDFVKRKVKLGRVKGKIKITSEPSQASIYIDGKTTGKKTPDVILTEPGEHDLKLVAEGKVYEGKITVESERRIVEHITQFKDADTGGMVLIKGGCFKMGNTFGGGDEDEKPAHEVCVEDFQMSDHEVTKGEFSKFVDATGYRTEGEKKGSCQFYEGEWKDKKGMNWRNPGFSQSNDHPVVCVSWNDAKAYINWASKKTGQPFRLLTEAEWEYAARSGGKSEKWSGTSSESSLGSYAWYGGNSGNKTHPVKTKSPNGLGLYDMSGNVWEWVSDWYGKEYYQSSSRMNPNGPSSVSYRVYRGGSWDLDPRFLRASSRLYFSPDLRYNYLGFRLARTY